MTDMNSPNFRRKLAAQQQSLRQFDVGPPEDDFQGDDGQYEQPAPLTSKAVLPSPPKDYKEVRAREVGKDRVHPFAKQRIEILSNLGRLGKDVEIDGTVFSLRTLKNKETRDATLSIFKSANDAEASYELRRQTLARCIYMIDGMEMFDILGSDSLEDRLLLVDELEDSVVTKLFMTFDALRNESKEKFGLKDEADAKVVGDDLKK